MSRLTVVDNNGNWGLKNGYKLENVPSAIYGHICKLKEYEDTELEPEQLDDINNLYLEKCKEVNELKNVMESVRQNSVSHEVYNEKVKYNNLDKKFTSMMTDYENKITSLKIEIMNLKRLVESEELV